MRKIIHVDMDAFFASVEQRDEPSLKGRPVIVGGLPDERGVVCAASYEARMYGVHSAMPSRTAVQKCPQAVFLRPRFEAYKQVSEEIHEIFHRYTDLVEPLSLDEAFLDVTENKLELPSATLLARQIKADILKQTGLTASAGVSINKFLAKTACGMRKPDGLYLIPPDRAEAFVERLSIDAFFGIGKVTAEKMRQLGINSGADLKEFSEEDLVRHFGKSGRYFYNIARGVDDRIVSPDRTRKSVGAEESFARDLTQQSDIMSELEKLAVNVERRMVKGRVLGKTVTLKVKYSDYSSVTRSRTLIHHTNDMREILAVVIDLLEHTDVRSRAVRLLGISVSNLKELDSNDEEEVVQLRINLLA